MNLVTELEAARAHVEHLTRLWSVACFHPNIAAAIAADEVLDHQACIVEAEQATTNDPTGIRAARLATFRRDPSIDRLKEIWK